MLSERAKTLKMPSEITKPLKTPSVKAKSLKNKKQQKFQNVISYGKIGKE